MEHSRETFTILYFSYASRRITPRRQLLFQPKMLRITSARLFYIFDKHDAALTAKFLAALKQRTLFKKCAMSEKEH